MTPSLYLENSTRIDLPLDRSRPAQLYAIWRNSGSISSSISLSALENPLVLTSHCKPPEQGSDLHEFDWVSLVLYRDRIFVLEPDTPFY